MTLRTIAQELAADLDEVEADVSATATINGTSYTVHPSDVTHGARLELEGFEATFDLSLTVQTADITGSRPGVNARIVYSGKTYRAERALTDAADAAVTYFCREAD